jgi:hypothetical protein
MDPELVKEIHRDPEQHHLWREAQKDRGT